jgi:hypothetical protein
VKRGRVVLGASELAKLGRGEPVLIRVKAGMEEIQIEASIVARAPGRYREGSLESIIKSFFDR